MSIKSTESGTIITGSGILTFHLMTWKYAVGLEAKGMRHSSGRSVRKHAALSLGLKANAKAEAVIAAIDAAIEANIASN